MAARHARVHRRADQLIPEQRDLLRTLPAFHRVLIEGVHHVPGPSLLARRRRRRVVPRVAVTAARRAVPDDEWPPGAGAALLRWVPEHGVTVTAPAPNGGGMPDSGSISSLPSFQGKILGFEMRLLMEFTTHGWAINPKHHGWPLISSRHRMLGVFRPSHQCSCSPSERDAEAPRILQAAVVRAFFVACQLPMM